jgi:cytochrome c-type biogenesis protein CcmH
MSLISAPTTFFAMETAFAAETAKSPVSNTGPQVKVESELEKKIRSVASMLRCPVCQGESVYDSHADVAVEMKRLIADKLKAGETTEEILTYFKDRYGNFVLMEPPAEGLHWVIWVFPIFMALLGGLFLIQNLKSGARELNESKLDDFDSQDSSDQDLSEVNDIKELRL